ncbi:MAG: M20/M25/M40 family metallo-hydrolase [Candidatus Rokubacteria bacterium]|nr:M20/M25/M40 family metallo-hydrolase [Candidatus Rokubacteria bacterium]MBI3827367.1 M20/M25/M40 family metallo-hydrolase [Candidatus Rokubacteria bacterium]
MINRDRVTGQFLDLVRISSPSGREGEVARYLGPVLRDLGASVEVDDAGAQAGSDTGNVLARIPATDPNAPPLFICGHMDTVVPCEHVRPVVEGDVVRTDGTSVLGGDDKAAIVAILEAVRVLGEQRIAHGAIELLFTICEENGLLGAKAFDVGRLTARTGLVLDCDGVDELITRAPATNHMRFIVHGHEAHAGIAPEQGISAIKVAAEAVAAMRLGRVDAETSANLGRIEGGLATNIVPNQVTLRGEARSLTVSGLEKQTEHMTACFEEAAARHRARIGAREYRARVETQVVRSCEPLDVPADARIVRLLARSAAGLDRPFRTRSTGGGSDANVFSQRGIEIANLACGMREIHTVHEWVDVRDLVSTSRLLVEACRLNASVS